MLAGVIQFPGSVETNMSGVDSKGYCSCDLEPWINAVSYFAAALSDRESDQDFVAELPISITPWLYLSDMSAALFPSKRTRQELRFTHVITTNELQDQDLVDLRRTLEKDLGIEQHLYLAGRDNRGFNLVDDHWERVYQYVRDTRSYNPNAKFLVHCVAGVNRSVWMAAALCMVIEKRSVLDVVKLIRKKRGRSILTNPSFIEQLCDLARLHNCLGEMPHASVFQNEEEESNLGCVFV